jgi:outer membrane protein assembly factor BamC
MNKIIILSTMGVILSGCFDKNIKEDINQSSKIGNKGIRYYADKTVNNLEIPPDLTIPDKKNALIIDQFVDNDENITTFDENKIEILSGIKGQNININVKKNNNIRWLVVNKDANFVWDATRGFLKDSGFSILKSNKNIGILETNYLENKENIPNKNLGVIRSMFKKLLKQDTHYQFLTNIEFA